jgi:hypothetical protein
VSVREEESKEEPGEDQIDTILDGIGYGMMALSNIDEFISSVKSK